MLRGPRAHLVRSAHADTPSSVPVVPVPDRWLALLSGRRGARADLDLPRPSPFAKVTQTVGYTDITVDYSSPGVKGRKIWGNVVPYDKLWRAGANQATKVTFSRDVTFAGKPVPAGTYAFFVIPSKGAWTVILNKKADQPGTGTAYNQADDLLRVQLTPKAAPMRERLAYLVTDFTDDKASLDLEWEKLRLAIPIGLDTAKQAQAAVDGAVDNVWRTYATAARYMLETKKDYADRHEVHRPVAGPERGLVQRLDQSRAAGRAGALRRGTHDRTEGLRHGQQVADVLPRGRDQKEPRRLEEQEGLATTPSVTSYRYSRTRR